MKKNITTNLDDIINAIKDNTGILNDITYAKPLINLANFYSHATKPENVGQLSELFPKFIKYATNKKIKISKDNWENWYNSQEIVIKGKKISGKQAIDNAVIKIQDYLNRFIKAIKDIESINIDENINEEHNKNNIQDWVEDLIYKKTFIGLSIQSIILNDIADGKEFKLGTKEQEAKGIDGIIDEDYYSVKPESYKTTHASDIENIEADYIVFYEIKNNEILYERENNEKIKNKT